MNKKLILLLCLMLIVSFFWAQDICDLKPKAIKELKGDREQKNSSALVVECNTPSAQVYLNSIYQGTTKLTVNQLLPGEYILMVVKPGYKTEQYYVTAKKGYSLTYRVELKKEEQLEE